MTAIKDTGTRATRRTVLAGACATLAACGLGRTGGSAEGGVAPPPGRIGPAELRFAGWWDPQQVAGYEAQFRAFAQRQADVRVQIEVIAFGVDKVLVQIAGGAAPDVIWVNNDQAPAYAAVGGVIDLGPLLARDLRELGTFLEKSQAQYVYRGKQYALTDFVAPIFTHFHPELFRVAGLKRTVASHKDKGWTTADLLQTARQLTPAQGGDTKQFGFYVSTSSNRFFPALWAFGGDVFDDAKEPQQLRFDSPQNVAAVEWLTALRTREHVTPTAAEERAAGWAQRWRDGTLAMVYEGPWSWPGWSTMDFNWDLLPVAAGSGGRWTRLAGAGYGIWTGSKYREAAWAWVKFLLSPAGLKLSAYDRARLQGVPVQREVVEDPQWAAWLTPEAKKLLAESPAYGKISPLHPKWPQLQQAMDAELAKAFAGTVGAKEAVTQAHNQMQQVLVNG